MRKQLIAVTLVGVAGCASHGVAPAPVGTFATSPADERRPVNSVQLQEDQAVRTALKIGYHAKLQNGEKVYCREQSVPGSHFVNNYCLNPGQLIRAFDRQTEVQDMLRQPFICSGGYMCNGIVEKGVGSGVR